MKNNGFTWTTEELDDDYYKNKALESEKESDKYYPGLKQLNFILYSFKFNDKENS